MICLITFSEFNSVEIFGCCPCLWCVWTPPFNLWSVKLLSPSLIWLRFWVVEPPPLWKVAQTWTNYSRPRNLSKVVANLCCFNLRLSHEKEEEERDIPFSFKNMQDLENQCTHTIIVGQNFVDLHTLQPQLRYHLKRTRKWAPKFFKLCGGQWPYRKWCNTKWFTWSGL